MEIMKIYGNDHDPAAIKQLEDCMIRGNAVAGCLMADGHKGYDLPIGGVLVTENTISPGAVGYDIGCGNMAMQLRLNPGPVRDNIKTILKKIRKEVPIGVGSGDGSNADHVMFDLPEWEIEPMKSLLPLAKQQLGSVGAGNHYVDIFEEAENPHVVWIAVHFGSRGFGHKIAQHFINLCPTGFFYDNDPRFHDYATAMNLAQMYAKFSRALAVEKVWKILGMPDIISHLDNHHNFASLENGLWITRKGATKICYSYESYIGGSMGDSSFIVRGVDSPELEDSYFSGPHGAGRVMGRMQAKGKIKINKETGEERIVREPQISREMMDAWLLEKGVTVLGGDVDESPHVYRRLNEVLESHSYIEIVHELKPIGVVMA
jgi:tRNA-splicing ligase RtcB (3'-phosphate/5'-hydroxy nucleic acid ligase)